jgi:hypothetical protein
MSIQHVAAVLDCRDPKLASCKKLVLIALANRTDQAGQCWPSQELLAGECGITPRTLRDHILALETDGFIVRETTQFGQGKGARTVYRIVLSSLKSAPEEIAAAKFAPEVFDTCTGSLPPLKSNLQEPTLDDDDSASAENGFEEKCREWAGDRLAPNASGIEKLQALLSLSSDEVCTEADVQRGIRNSLAWLQRRDDVANSFAYFVNSVLKARDTRLKPVTPSERKSFKRAETSKSDELDRFLARARVSSSRGVS